MIPTYWRNFITVNDIIGCDFEVSEEDDLSQLGADMRIMSIEQCISEATECYPGIVALKEGYVPVAMCLAGSGDYYYIKTTEGENGSLYRVYHDAVDGNHIASSGIEKVLNRYVSLL
ncbi:SMI1/KNR4 family protein [Photobacterium halotolerans]|uniref:SMI1/KNR4 family protein n=1 Tax=Photobacterium halotolerans TaxID=265726 RepID=A0A0F5VC76_9GAMM|nr:SMI1/KNR4 family protein [Photobacterium halotolerans]KKC99069.1 hypothetical protein KY46_14595 [Photobacterium halotolerans]